LYILSIGDYPFYDYSDNKTLKSSQQIMFLAKNIQQLQFQNHKKYIECLSKELKSLLFQSLLILDVNIRYNYKQILKSEWFQKMQRIVQSQGLTFAKIRALRQDYQDF
jgi:hypothetical protein